MRSRTIKNNELYLGKFGDWYGGHEIKAVSPDDILAFLTAVTEGLKRSTKRYKYTLLKSFFNFATSG